MGIRIATLNLERNEKRWQKRRDLIVQQLAGLKPDLLSMNELWLPSHTGRWICEQAQKRLGENYLLIEQPRADKPSHPEAEGLLTKFPIVERSHRFFSAGDTVTFVVRLRIEEPVDVYVTHLYPARHDETQRVGQVQELLSWIKERSDVEHKIVCGDCNAMPAAQSMQLMAREFRPTQTAPTAFTPLREANGEPTHPEWERFDRCIDYIWVSESIRIQQSGLCFDQPPVEDPTLWPSDHVGVWADLEFA